MIEDVLKITADIVRLGVDSFSMPRISEWRITGAGSATLSVDVADLGTLGATYVAPINLNVAGGSTELSLFHKTANLSFVIEGWGGGISGGIGWSAAPISGSYGGGGLAHITDGGGLNLPSSGIGSLIAGPRASSHILAPVDFEGFITIQSLALNFAVNGIGGGIVMFADRPIASRTDLIHLKAIGLITGIHLVGACVSAEIGAMYFHCSVRPSSLAQPGASYGMCIPHSP